MKDYKGIIMITISLCVMMAFSACANNNTVATTDVKLTTENIALVETTNVVKETEANNISINTADKKVMTIDVPADTPIADDNGKYPGSEDRRDVNRKVVTFGNYFQDASGNAKKPLDWIVLDEKEGYSLLLTKDVVYSMGWVRDGVEGLTWAETDLRKWLDEDFYNAAFSENEKNNMAVFNATQPQNPRYNTPAGEATVDYVSLLSYQELIKYMPTEFERKTKPTAYAVANGNYVNTDGDSAWWLRSPGPESNIPEHLATWGNLGARTHYVNDYIIGVRPAIWVNSEYLK